MSKGRTGAWKDITTNDHIDNAIREAYAQGKMGAIKAVAERIDRPYHWVRYRARQIGILSISKWHTPRWTKIEDELLEKSAHLSGSTIYRRLKRAGFNRSMNAIERRISDLALDRDDPDHFTVADFAVIMGTSKDAVTRWMRKGLLREKKLDKRLRIKSHLPPGEGRRQWIARADAKAFIQDYPQYVDLRKVDKYSFLDLTIGSPRVGLRELNREQKEAA